MPRALQCGSKTSDSEFVSCTTTVFLVCVCVSICVYVLNVLFVINVTVLKVGLAPLCNQYLDFFVMDSTFWHSLPLWLHLLLRTNSSDFYSSLKPVVHNVRPAGHIRPATSPHVARGVQQEK